MSFIFNNTRTFDQLLGGWNIEGVRDMHHMFDNSGMSTNSYDVTLQGWSALPTTQSGVELGAQGLTYCASEAARARLISSSQWTIVGDQKTCL